ncbi:MAG: phosphoenolpyruvate--protein phosphotransferase [Minwuia sp.]|nr:phosphoenolpyruvate--protein phosphotransferase [Minwuia sp.]
MKRDAAAQSRQLLSDFRTIMQSAEPPEARLAEVVRLVARNMGAEVCSVYIRRADGALELFETEGLRREAIRITRMEAGVGLVGHVAETSLPVRLRDARSSPAFEPRPETGEDAYMSFMGVPILYADRVLGVLVVQNISARDYHDEEQEALEMLALVFGQMIASGALVPPETAAESVAGNSRPTRMAGRSLADGFAKGHAVLHTPHITVRQTVADDPEEELIRLDNAIRDVHDQIDEMLSQPAIAAGESRTVMEAFRLFAHDPGWQRRMREAVDTGLTAEAAVKRTHDQTRARFRKIPDPYIRARLADMDDLANRLFNRLNADVNALENDLPDDVVLIARDMGPAELLDFDETKLRAVILEQGSVGSHMSIVARALDIPVIGGCTGATDRINSGDLVIVDGDHEQVFVRPDQDVIDAFGETEAMQQEVQARRRALRDVEAVTRDGMKVELHCNAGLLLDLRHLDETGADGIGLYRTELHYMVRSRLPRMQEQATYYKHVLDAAGDRPVIFRTLDVGSDKLLPYLKRDPEPNPAMGWRAVRISLDQEALFRMQLRALLAAAEGRELRVMFPMIADIAEFEAARAVLTREVEWAKARGRAGPATLKVGVMLEVPALVWRLPALLPRVDFVSIGSNDLMQFMYAADRGNPRVATRYDTLSPGFISSLRRISEQCQQHHVEFSICGEMASQPLEAMVLVALGFRKLSMRPNAIGAVKEMILSLDTNALRQEMSRMGERNEGSLRPMFEAFAAQHGVKT